MFTKVLGTSTYIPTWGKFMIVISNLFSQGAALSIYQTARGRQVKKFEISSFWRFSRFWNLGIKKYLQVYIYYYFGKSTHLSVWSL